MPATAGVTATTSDPNPGNNAAFALTTVGSGASTLVVTNANDSGPGSLRSAIQHANDPGPRDTITFNIPGAGVHTIRPTTVNGLPSLNQPVVIDATTQPGYSGTPLIEISGENAGLVSGLVINAGNTVIRGLAINRFQIHGISVPAGTGNIIEANVIGTNPAGTSALPNAGSGIDIRAGSHRVGGSTAAARNVISGNQLHGIEISGNTANGNQVLGNCIGTNVAGTAALGNTLVGVEINQGASNNSIGGSTHRRRQCAGGQRLGWRADLECRLERQRHPGQHDRHQCDGHRRDCQWHVWNPAVHRLAAEHDHWWNRHGRPQHHFRQHVERCRALWH